MDIDVGSRYHNREGFAKIVGLLEKAGISEYNVYRSSESGGWHIYLFFDAPISSRDLYKQLSQLFKLHDFEVAKGTLEIFPHPGNKSLGQGLRLPLQPGFAWLNSDGLAVYEERDGMSPAEALYKFINDMECNVNPYHQFHKLKAFVEKVSSTREIIVAKAADSSKVPNIVPIRVTPLEKGTPESLDIVKSIFGRVPPGIKADTWLKGREYFYLGLTGPSQRAEAVFSLSHYLFYGDPERLISPLGYGYENERRWLIEELLRTKHNGQSKDLASGHVDGLKQIERVANWIPPHRRGKETLKYESNIPISWVRNNQNRAALARKKIISAVEDFQEAGIPFSTRDLSLKCGVSTRTIAKYPELWKQAMEDLRNGFLESDLHEYNAVVGATSQESQPPTSNVLKVMPPGRLAARQIVYELKMRSLREERRKQSVSLRGEKLAVLGWRDRVDGLMKKGYLDGSSSDLRILINLLARELLIAPTEEDWLWLSGYISSLKEFLVTDGYPVQLSLGLRAPAS